jgi:hypothetical protein
MRARVIWFSAALGGRESGPPSGAQFRPNGFFIRPESGKNTMPPESSIFTGVIFDFVEHNAEHSVADLTFTFPELAKPYAYDGSAFLVYEGARAIGYAQIVDAP